MRVLPALLVAALALGLGMLAQAAWPSHPTTGQAIMPPSLAPRAQAPSQLQAVLQGPRHRVQSLHAVPDDHPSLAGLPTAMAEDSVAEAALFPALVTADRLLETGDSARRSHLHAAVARRGAGFTLTLFAIDDQWVQPPLELTWQPGQAADDARDRLVDSVCHSLLALAEELRNGQRQALQSSKAGAQDDAAGPMPGSQDAAAPAPILLLGELPTDGAYRVLSSDDLDEIQVHADGSLLWLRSMALHADIPSLHSALRVQPQSQRQLPKSQISEE